MFVRPNILRTLRRTMIRFLTEHLVRRIWFGQSRLYFILNWLVMRCKLRPELAADAQQTAWWKCRLKSSQVKSSQYTLIIPHRVIQLTTISFWVLRDKAAPSTSQQINKFPSKRVKNLATPSSIFSLVFFSIYRRALLSANQRQWSSNRANVPRTCWAKVFGPRI